MQIKEVMGSKVQYLGPDSSVFEASQKMKIYNVGVLPIQERNKVIGIITDRDIIIRAVAEGHDVKAVNIQKIMSLNIHCCYLDDHVEKAVQYMMEYKVRRIPILDRQHNNLVGIFSLEDLAVYYSFNIAGELLKKISEKAN